MIRADDGMTPSDGLTKMADAMHPTQTCAGAMSMRKGATTLRCFKVRILNITTMNQFTASTGVKWSLGFSPGTFVVTSKAQPYFKLGTPDQQHGLRSVAEEGDPSLLTTYDEKTFPGSGAFLVPVGGTKPKGIAPGESYEFFVAAQPGERLYVTTMMGQSNDWFYANPLGIELFTASGKPTGGDVTSSMRLLDAGTEADEEMGIGPSQGPREPHPRFGPDDPNPLVRIVTTDARFVAPAKHMRVTVTPE
jgi:hypothetical protein